MGAMLAAVVRAGAAQAQAEVQVRAEPAIVPKPAELRVLDGNPFVIGSDTRIVVKGGDPELTRVGAYLSETLEASTGRRLRVDAETGAGPWDKAIALVIGSGEGGGLSSRPEGYQLTSGADAVVIRGSTARGVFYGIQTLRQLLPPVPLPPPDIWMVWSVPAVAINDAPRFGWRGLMMDSGRHFFAKAEIEKLLDVMAFQKMNVFHWHLTEDEGWRLEIRKYPRLTEVGSWRDESPVRGDPGRGDPKRGGTRPGDGLRYGGFYTQDDVREVVAYAAARFITIVPEIEMPGHASAAIASYPELGNSDIPDYHPGVMTHWGVSPYIYAPKEETFRFLEDVLTEVVGLFPGRYVHIGGDEAVKDQWKKSAFAQGFIREHGLGDEEGLQGYFVRRIEKILNARGRRLVGWDEIRQGGLSATATLMVWHEPELAVGAIGQGNDVILSPNEWVYLDHLQADATRYPEPEAIGYSHPIPLARVYAFDPVAPQLRPDQAAHVLGTESPLWSEYIWDGPKLEYMAFPRASALAEVAWSPRERRNYPDFCRRLTVWLARLRAAGINYRPPTPEDLEAAN